MSTWSFKIVNQFLECRVGFLWGNWPFWFSWWFSLYLGPRPYVEACPVFTAFQDFRPWFNFPWKTLGHFRKIDERIKNWGTLKASFLNNHAITCNGLLIEIKIWVSPPSIMEPRLHIWWFLVPIIISFHLRHYKRSLRLTAPPWEERIPIASLWHHSGQICRSSCTGRMTRVVFVHLLSCFIRVRLGVKF